MISYLVRNPVISGFKECKERVKLSNLNCTTKCFKIRLYTVRSLQQWAFLVELLADLCTDPKRLDQNSNDWRSVLLGTKITINSARNSLQSCFLVLDLTSLVQDYVLDSIFKTKRVIS